MPKPPIPAPAKRASKTVSKPSGTAAAAAPAAKAAAAPAARRAAKIVDAAPVVVAEAAAKPAKVHKPKLVRDSFTIPKDEYQVLAELKSRALGLEVQVRKSELLRAGIQALSSMTDRSFLSAIAAVPTLKTGRPKAD